jgi:PAS domain S-box-containing protein
MMDNSTDINALFHDAPIAMFEFGDEGNIVDINYALVDMLGYNSKSEMFELVKDVAKDIYVDETDRTEILEKLWQSDSLSVHETKFKKKNGELINVKISAWNRKISGNKKAGKLGIVEDITETIKNQIQQKEQEHRYKTLFENSNDAIIILEKMNLIEWNNKACEMFYGEKQCEELPAFESLHPEKQPDDRNSLEKGMELIELTLDGKPQYFEWVHKRLNGDLFYAEVTLSPLDKEKKITQAIVRDISERKADEERIKNSEQMYRQLVELAPDGIFTINNQGLITNVNKAFCALGGYDKDKYLNKYFYDAFDLDSESMTKAVDLFKSLKDKNEIQLTEINWTHKDGSIHYGVAHAVSFENTQKERVIQVVLRDTTEEKTAVEKIIANESLLKSIIDSIPIGMWVIDKNNVIIAQSGLAQSKWGKYVGKNIEQFQEVEVNPEYQNIIQNKVLNGEVYEDQQSIVIDNKKVFFKRLTAPYYRNKEVAGYIAFSLNITELVQYQKELERHRNNLEYLVKERTEEIEALNEELRSSNEQLEYQRDDLRETLEELRTTQNQLVHSEKMASVGILTAGIAHEINNPVNFISSGTIGLEHVHNDFIDSLKEIDVFLENILNEEEFIKYNQLKEKLEIHKSIENMPQLMEAMKIGVERIVSIVKSLRTFSRMDTEEKVEVDINDTIDSSLTILFNKYKHRIEIIKKLDDDSVIKAFPGKLGQVILNLVMNAIQAIEDKGNIEIETHKKNKTFEIIITDDGKGMDSEIQKKMFDPFYTTKDPGEGTGLGMSIVHSIIKEHKGKIDVNSQQGIGTQIHISIPIA